VNKFLKILSDGNPHKIPRMGTLLGIGHPLFFLPHFHEGKRRRPPSKGPGPASLVRATLREEETIHQIWGPFWKARGCFGGPMGVGERPDTPRLPAVSRSCQGFPRTGNHAGVKSACGADITRNTEDAGRGFTARRYGGGFPEQVAGKC
jgi:hypothetical protein